MELTSIPGLGPAFRDRLRDAGVPDVAALAHAGDLAALAERTGIPMARLTDFQAAAQLRSPPAPKSASDGAAAIAAVTAGHKAEEQDAGPEARVVLRDRVATARVKIGSIWLEDVPIVTARFNEDGEKVIAALKENAVLLKEQATTAVVRVNDQIHEGLPIFKERLREGTEGVAEEIRVRVQSIKERVPEAAKDTPIWKRMFGRGA